MALNGKNTNHVSKLLSCKSNQGPYEVALPTAITDGGEDQKRSRY